MNQHTIENRLRRAESIVNDPNCHTCNNTGSLLVHVPPGEDRAAKAYNPEHCAECGRPIKHLKQVVGIDRETVARMHARRESVR